MINAFLLTLWSGIIILIGAILINGLGSKLGIETWYGYLNSIADKGFGETNKILAWPNLLFLYIIYPLCLGGLGLMGVRSYEFFIRHFM